MQFLFCESGGDSEILLKGEIYNYIFKIRRHRSEKHLFIRNPNSSTFMHEYKIQEIDRRKAKLVLINSQENVSLPEKNISLGWCVVDSKTIEKTLPMINELGVQNIYFIYCDFSQKDIKLDFNRFDKILQNSSMQSGRFNTVNLHLIENITEFLEKFPETVAIDFADNKIETINKKDVSILIGAEGGFSESERALFQNIRGLKSPYILKSQTAVISAINLI